MKIKLDSAFTDKLSEQVDYISKDSPALDSIKTY